MEVAMGEKRTQPQPRREPPVPPKAVIGSVPGEINVPDIVKKTSPRVITLGDLDKAGVLMY